MIAVQGPNARARRDRPVARGDRAPVSKLLRFAAREAQTADGVEVFVARTGYTGEDGFEIDRARGAAVAFWNALLDGGREAGRPRRARHPAPGGRHEPLRPGHGRHVTPFEAALAWTVALDEGRATSSAAPHWKRSRPAGAPRQMVGLVMDEKGVLRHGQKVLTANGEGEILSGTFSPTHRQGDRVRARPGRRPGRRARRHPRPRGAGARGQVPVRPRRQGPGRHLTGEVNFHPQLR
jgi:aminomethyltransferase